MTQIEARPVQAKTKGQVKRLRREGFIPVSIQHRGEETRHYELEAKPLQDFIYKHGEASLLDLSLAPDGGTQTVLVHDVQRDPISRHLLQVTFQSVVRGEPIKTHVPIVTQGEPESVRNNLAVLTQATAAVEVRCLPGDLPDHITVDVSNLETGAEVRVADLRSTGKYEILTSPETVLVSVARSKAAFVEEAPAEAGEDNTGTPGAGQTEAA